MSIGQRVQQKQTVDDLTVRPAAAQDELAYKTTPVKGRSMAHLGIRIGRTNISAVVSDGATEQPVRFGMSDGILPIAVARIGDGAWIIGADARARRLIEPESAVVELLDHPPGSIWLANEQFDTVLIWTELLTHVRRAAEDTAGEGVESCVLSVPTNLDERQACELRDAAAQAGLRLVDVVADAVAETHNSNAHGLVLMLRMGGRDCQVALWESGKSGRLLASHVDISLGGVDIDRAIADWFLKRVQDNPVPVDESWDRRVLAESERVKHILSRAHTTRMRLVTGDGVGFEQELSAAEFDQLARPTVRRAIVFLTDFVDNYRNSTTSQLDIDSIVLSGGSSHLRLLRDELVRVAGRDVITAGDAQRSAARGALAIARQRAAPPPDRDRSEFHDDETTLGSSEDGDSEPLVQFTVYRPRRIRPRVWHPLLAYAHLAELPPDADPDEPDPVEEVERSAKKILGPEVDEYSRSTRDSAAAVPQGDELVLVPEVEHVEFNPSHMSFRWLKRMHKAEFEMRALPEAEDTVATGYLRVFRGPLLIAEVPLRVRVDNQATPAEEAPTEATRGHSYRKIFASYSHRDAVVVDRFEAFAKGFGDKYLRDIADLRAGERWSERLQQLIDEADVFQLFWSWESSRSKHVENEWRHALGRGRNGFIRPMYWETPPPDPPDELRSIQFAHVPLAIASAERSSGTTARVPKPGRTIEFGPDGFPLAGDGDEPPTKRSVTEPTWTDDRGTAGPTYGEEILRQRQEVRDTDTADGLQGQEPERQLRIMLHMVHNLAKTGDPAVFLPSTLQSLFELFPQAESGSVLLRDEATGQLRVVAQQQRREDADPNVASSRAVVDRALESKMGVVSTDVAPDSSFEMLHSIASVKFRSVMCVPMVRLDGEAVGVIHLETRDLLRQFTAQDLEVLDAAASQAALAIENARIHSLQLEEVQRRRELELARSVQQTWLPNRLPDVPGWQFHVSSHWAQAVDGDYYDVFPLDTTYVCVAVGEAAGRGMAAALMVARLAGCVRNLLPFVRDVREMMRILNVDLCRNSPLDRFATLLLAIVDVTTGETTLVNAGHILPLLRHSDGSVCSLPAESSGLPLGIIEEFQYESIRQTLQPGEWFILTTDGASDSMAPDGRLYTKQNLVRVIAGSDPDNVDLSEVLIEDILRHTEGKAPVDDITVLTFGRTRNDG